MDNTIEIKKLLNNDKNKLLEKSKVILKYSTSYWNFLDKMELNK